MTEISKEAKHLILLVDFIDERVNQMDGRSLYEINNCIQLLRTRILAIQASVAELEYEQSADFDMGRVQGLEQPSVQEAINQIKPDAVHALASYQQADQEGIMVLVSRQAIEECLPALRALKGGE